MERSHYHHGDLKNALIQAGIEILAEEGAGGLSLRKVAHRAGVSHAAPYAHFTDKQALIAAIASDGHSKIHERLKIVMEEFAADPLRQFTGAVWAYVQFGLDTPSHYKITFSGAIQDEHGHPEFIEMSQRNMHLLKTIVERCRTAGILDAGNDLDSGLQAFSIWGVIHGMVSLIIQGQLPSEVMKRVKPEELLLTTLRQIVHVPINESMFH